MKDIKELALKVAIDVGVWQVEPSEVCFTEARLTYFATRLIAAYLAEQEPVGKVLRNSAGQVWIIWKGETDIIDYVGQQLFTAPPEPEPAQNLYREIYEVWAGSEGIPMPRTAPEAYLLGLLEQMVDIAKTGMHMTEPAPQTDGSTTVSAPDQERMSRSACAAPSSDEVREMVERLCSPTEPYGYQSQLACEAADLIERLAARVPDGCVVVGYLDGRGRFFYADDPHMEIDHTGMREVFAAGEVKP